MAKDKKVKKPAKAEKPKAKKVEVKVEAKKALVPVVTKTVSSDLKAAELRQEEARVHFNDMQRSWFFFAKALCDIRTKELYKILGKDSFKDFCNDEYPTISWSTIFKYISIVENWGKAIEARLSADKNWRLPAYESCYKLVVLEDKMPKEELAKLRKEVLDSKLSYHSLVDRLKSFAEKAREKDRAEVDDSTDEIERQLEEDIKRDKASSEDGFMPEREETLDTEDDEADVVIDSEAEDDDKDSPYPAMNTRVAYLLDNLPVVTKKLNSKTICDDSIDFAKDAEKLQKILGDYLDKVEEISNE